MFLLGCLFSFVIVKAKDNKWSFGIGAGLSLLEYQHIGQSGPVGLQSIAFLPELFAEYRSGKRIQGFSLILPKYNNWKYTDSGDPAAVGSDMFIAELLWDLKWRLGKNEERAVRFYIGPLASIYYRNWNNAFEGGITRRYRLISAKVGGIGKINYHVSRQINFYAEGVFGGFLGKYNSSSENEPVSSGKESGIISEMALGLNWSPTSKFTITPLYRYGTMYDYNNLYSLKFRESVIELRIKYQIGNEK